MSMCILGGGVELVSRAIERSIVYLWESGTSGGAVANCALIRANGEAYGDAIVTITWRICLEMRLVLFSFTSRDMSFIL